MGAIVILSSFRIKTIQNFDLGFIIYERAQTRGHSFVQKILQHDQLRAMGTEGFGIRTHGWVAEMSGPYPIAKKHPVEGSVWRGEGGLSGCAR
jgi:hypothetical protein